MGLDNLIKTMNSDQVRVFNEIDRNKRLQICMPTGWGKGYIMMLSLLHKFLNKDEDIAAIASHRLTLNHQHIGDMISTYADDIDKLGFIFVGSDGFDFSSILSNQDDNYISNPETKKKIFQILYKNKISFKDIAVNTLSNKDVLNAVARYRSMGKKIIIVSTYHSLDKLSDINIDSLYCDEAHTLASEDSRSNFKVNYDLITKKNCYFFTATPKDCADDLMGQFLMDNEHIFGNRIEMSLRDAHKGGYIAKLMLHTLEPENYNHEDYDNITNKILLIESAYKEHTKILKENSSFPDDIEPKLLIKCDSVDTMWMLNKRLVNRNLGTGVRIFSGASRKFKEKATYEIDGEKVDKGTHLRVMKDLKDTERAIVLHVDTLSEGVNVKSFTGVLFLSDKVPTTTKILQNSGRAARLMKQDRENLRKGKITTDSYEGWLKPCAYVILPCYNPESFYSQRTVANIIQKFQTGDSAEYYISIGSDTCKVHNNQIEDMKGTFISDKDFKTKVDKITHSIERINISEDDLRLNSLSKIELLKEKFN